MSLEHENLLPLLQKTAAGNQAAFESLYAQTSGQLYAVALKMLKNKEGAEEATQEAYINIWYKASYYQEGQGTVLTWLVSIVRYRALDIIRHKKVRNEDAHDEEYVGDNTDENASPFQSVKGYPKLDMCMNELDSQQRQAIHLAYFNGLSHSEVVQHLSTPLGTIKSWIRRGLVSLQRCLNL
jgi:RNA polymerase sigma-70 factor (ECF subfamily)